MQCIQQADTIAVSALDSFAASAAAAVLPASAAADAAQVEAKEHAMSLLFTAAAHAPTANSYGEAAGQLATAGYDVDASFRALVADFR